MAMPNDLILIRHGESEANIVQKQINDLGEDASVDLAGKHDGYVRLSPTGVKQAQSAGAWLKEHNLATFDRYCVSPFARARETAGYLALDGDWRIDDRLREQNWGIFNLLSWDQIQNLDPASRNLREQFHWYWQPRDGESLASGVRARFESLLSSLNRKTDGKKVIAATHGGYMNAARFVLERITPEKWKEDFDNGDHRIFNAHILHYTRLDPETGQQAPYLKWRRAICPWDESLSWDDGKWIEISARTYNDQELLEFANLHPHLLEAKNN